MSTSAPSKSMSSQQIKEFLASANATSVTQDNVEWRAAGSYDQGAGTLVVAFTADLLSPSDSINLGTVELQNAPGIPPLSTVGIVAGPNTSLLSGQHVYLAQQPSALAPIVQAVISLNLASGNMSQITVDISTQSSSAK